ALTNVSRHAEASRATVLVRQADGRLVVEVQDDGRGGAVIGEHDGIVPTGLRGLADRVAGVDGNLVVTSPPGGPTVLRAELPC
ncbi:MAG: sensor histidine kinase, partial [Acidimicrobiia bacterium]